MPFETRKFEGVDKTFKFNMEEIKMKDTLWDTIDGEKMNSDFIRANKLLEKIQKSLSEYLHTKRLVFPRFFFVSEDQLLEILAQTKDPLQVQKHLPKIFEAIH
jgi:dynein heavy chain, axonemal